MTLSKKLHREESRPLYETAVRASKSLMDSDEIVGEIVEE